MRRLLLAATAIALFAGAAFGESASTYHVVYEHPDAPATSWFTVLELPSYIFMPGAPIGGLGYGPTSGSSSATPTGDLDCSDFSGPVPIYNGTIPTTSMQITTALVVSRPLRFQPKVIPFPRRSRRYSPLVVGSIAVIVASLGVIGTVLNRPSSPTAEPAALVSATKSSVPKLRMCRQMEKNTSTKTCVVDGDTLWISGVKYRLESFDTPEPETDICGGEAEVALAHKASARLLQLLNSNQWTMATGGVDRTGTRTLATIWIGGQDVGDILIRERLARRWPDGDEWWCR